MKPIGFLVADKNMEACVHGLVLRPHGFSSIGCSAVDIQRQDVHVAAGQNDPGLFAHGDTLIRPLASEYKHIVVMLDNEWDGSPGKDAILRRMERHFCHAGVAADRALALVLEPEVDSWLWTRSDHTAKALGWESWHELEKALTEHGWWSPDRLKPARPKEAAAWALANRRKPRSSRVYERVAETVGLERCSDPAFLRLKQAMREWFPASS